MLEHTWRFAVGATVLFLGVAAGCLALKYGTAVVIAIEFTALAFAAYVCGYAVEQIIAAWNRRTPPTKEGGDA